MPLRLDFPSCEMGTIRVAVRMNELIPVKAQKMDGPQGLTAMVRVGVTSLFTGSLCLQLFLGFSVGTSEHLGVGIASVSLLTIPAQ